MDPEFVIKAVRSAIAQELEVDLASLQDDASLRRFYRLDSVAAVNIIFHLEQVLEIEIDMALIARIDSVNDLRAVLTDLLATV